MPIKFYEIGNKNLIENFILNSLKKDYTSKIKIQKKVNLGEKKIYVINIPRKSTSSTW